MCWGLCYRFFLRLRNTPHMLAVWFSFHSTACKLLLVIQIQVVYLFLLHVCLGLQLTRLFRPFKLTEAWAMFLFKAGPFVYCTLYIGTVSYCLMKKNARTLGLSYPSGIATCKVHIFHSRHWMIYDIATVIPEIGSSVFSCENALGPAALARASILFVVLAICMVSMLSIPNAV